MSDPINDLDTTYAEHWQAIHAGAADLHPAAKAEVDTLLKGHAAMKLGANGYEAKIDGLFGRDDIPDATKVARAQVHAATHKEELDTLEAATSIRLDLLKAELEIAAVKTLDPAREGFVRADVAAYCEGRADKLSALKEIAGGPDRDMAAAAYRHANIIIDSIASPKTRDDHRAALRGANLSGALAHGDKREKASAHALVHPEGVLNRAAKLHGIRTTQARIKSANTTARIMTAAGGRSLNR